MKLLSLRILALSLIATPTMAQTRPLNQLVGFSGLNDSSITQTAQPSVSISPGTYAIAGQGTISFTTGNFKVGCFQNGIPSWVDPLNPGTCSVTPNSTAENPPTVAGYIEFIPQYQNPAFGNPVCLFQADPDPTTSALHNLAPNGLVPTGDDDDTSAPTSWPVQFIPAISVRYFEAADSKMHVGLTFSYRAYPTTPYQINFICPPKGP